MITHGQHDLFGAPTAPEVKAPTKRKEVFGPPLPVLRIAQPWGDGKVCYNISAIRIEEIFDSTEDDLCFLQLTGMKDRLLVGVSSRRVREILPWLR